MGYCVADPIVVVLGLGVGVDVVHNGDVAVNVVAVVVFNKQ